MGERWASHARETDSTKFGQNWTTETFISTVMASTDTPPPPYFRTVYDETLRSITYTEPSIMSMANNPNLLGQLEYHSPTSDGSFSICVAGGDGIFISQVLISN